MPIIITDKVTSLLSAMMTLSKQRFLPTRKGSFSVSVRSNITVDIKLYIYGSKQLTAMVQNDMQRIEENESIPTDSRRMGYLIVIGSDEIE